MIKETFHDEKAYNEYTQSLLKDPIILNLKQISSISSGLRILKNKYKIFQF